MYIRALAVASLSFFLFVMASAGAEDVKIMGLMDTQAARSDSKRPLAYLTGSCQKKHKRMQCHLNEIAVNKLDTTLFEAKAKEVMDHVKNDPHNVDSVIERQMPYLCPDPNTGQDRLDEPSQSALLSPGEQELRQATRQFCAAKTADTLRALLDLRITMQARTCALWVTSYDKDFTLRGTEWVSTQGPSGPCGVMETAVFSSTLYDSHGQEIRFNRYRTRQSVTKKHASQCTAGADKEYVLVLEKPRYTDCVYISTLTRRPLAGVCGSLVRRNRCPPLREGDCSTRCQGADRYNSEHGSWLNIAECELSVLERQCLARRLPNINTPTREVTAWKQQRNQAHVTLDWRFTTADARIRLKRLYPVLKEHKEQKAA